MESNEYPGVGGTAFKITLNEENFMKISDTWDKVKIINKDMARKLLDEGKISMEEYTQILNQL